MSLKRIHFASGLVIIFFILMHLSNHVVSVISEKQHIEVMNTLRLLYRNVFIETLLILAVLIQIISGIKLFRIHRKIAKSFFEKLRIWSGLYLALFFIIHLSAVFAGRLILNLDTNFYFGVAGLNTFPINLFFIPYYSLAIIAFFGHMASIHSQKMTINIIGLTPTQQSKIILIAGVVLTLIILYGLTNHFEGVVIPEEYKVLTGE